MGSFEIRFQFGMSNSSDFFRVYVRIGDFVIFLQFVDATSTQFVIV